MKHFYKPLILLAFAFLAINARAQTDTADVKQAYFKIGINYVNNNVFLGRADTIRTPSVTPFVSYTLKSGLYFSGALEYFPNRTTDRLDGGNLEVGYNYNITDDWEGGFSFTKMFYNANSTQVSSSISSEFNASMDYDIADIITPSVSLDYSVGKSGTKNDILINAGLSHDILIEDIFGSDEILISPEAGINMGTQNFYDSYLVNRTIRLKRGAGLVQTEYNQNLKNYKDYLAGFRTLDYELTMPVVYKYKHLLLSFTPTYAFPQNGLSQPENIYQTAIQKGIPPLKTQFYFETGVTLKF